MKRKLFRGKVRVQRSKTHGYGVFAEKTFKKGELIEECYIVITKGGDKGLEDFYFDVNGKYAIFTGFGILYNHSEEPNADYTYNAKRKLARIKADRVIKKGEEIFISYGDKWFKERNLLLKDEKGKLKPTKANKKKHSKVKKLKKAKKKSKSA
jgi:hypothetical protein